MFALTLLAAAEEAPPPLIDLDWTVAIQFGLFLIMFFVLNQFLFQPYLKMREERGKSIEGAKQDAKKMDEQARATIADYDAKMSRAKQRGAEERALKRSEAAAREGQLLVAAREEAQKAMQAARMRVSIQTQQARTKLEAESDALARMMAQKILGREVA